MLTVHVPRPTPHAPHLHLRIPVIMMTSLFIVNVLTGTPDSGAAEKRRPIAQKILALQRRLAVLFYRHGGQGFGFGQGVGQNINQVDESHCPMQTLSQPAIPALGKGLTAILKNEDRTGPQDLSDEPGTQGRGFPRPDDETWVEKTDEVKGPAPSAFLEPCCTALELYEAARPVEFLLPGSINADPYVTGPLAPSGRPIRVRGPNYREPKNGTDYVYRTPMRVGRLNTIPIRAALEYQAPKLSLDQIQAYLKACGRSCRGIPKGKEGEEEARDSISDLLRLTEATNPHGTFKETADQVTFVGKGANSSVYLMHPPVPDSEFLKQFYPDTSALRTKFPEIGSPYLLRRRMWAEKNSIDVVKVRRSSPFGKEMQEAARQSRRDIVIENLFKEFSSKFSIVDHGEQKELIRVASYRNSTEGIRSGIFKQTAIHGDTAFEIAKRIRAAEAGDRAELKYLKETLHFESLEDAQRKLAVLEKFYHETYAAVEKFEKLNHIPMMANLSRNLEEKTVGFDYNLGQNVIWDSKEKMFYAVDF